MKVLNHKTDRRGHCGRCETVFPELFLIPVRGKVGKRNYEMYARAYRLGYQAALGPLLDPPA